MRADLFLMGYAIYRVRAEHMPLLFRIAKEKNISPKCLKRLEKGEAVRFVLLRKEARRFEKAAKVYELPFLREKEGGVPLFLRKLLHSPGVLVGIFLSLALFLGARLVVWDVRIEGNSVLSVEELESALASCGVFRGRFLPSLDVDAAALALRREDGRIAYAAINRKGTVLYVQIREAQSAPPAESKRPANLVAKCDGVITMPLVFEGVCLVSEGEVVRKGQILASGLIDTQNHGYRTTRAAGQILARTVEVYDVHVPLVFEEKRYTGEVKKEILLFLFHWRQKVFKSTGNYIDKCDIIEQTEWITLPTGEKLPFGYRITSAAEYTFATCQRTRAQARAIADEKLCALLDTECAGRTVLHTQITSREDADGITLTCTVVYEEDIAKVAEFTLQS